MSQHEKLLRRLLSRPADFTWAEAVKLLKHYEYVVLVNDGSRRKFKHSKTNRVIIIHVPHPQNELNKYSVNDIIVALKEGGSIK